MAIKVQTRTYSQQPRTLEESGYVRPTTVGLDAVARNLKSVASDIGTTKRFLESEERRKEAEQRQIEADDRRKQAELETLRSERDRKANQADKIVSDKFYTDWSNQLKVAEDALKDAYSANDEDKIAEALSVYDGMKPEGNFGGNLRLNNKAYLSEKGYTNSASSLWTDSKLRSDDRGNTYTILNDLRGDREALNNKYVQYSRDYHGKLLPNNAFLDLVNSSLNFMNNEKIDMLTSQDSKSAQISVGARNLVRTFKRQLGSAYTEEQVSNTMAVLDQAQVDKRLGNLSQASIDALDNAATSARKRIETIGQEIHKGILTSSQNSVSNLLGNELDKSVTTTPDFIQISRAYDAASADYLESAQNPDLLTDEQKNKSVANVVIADYLIQDASGFSRAHTLAIDALARQEAAGRLITTGAVLDLDRDLEVAFNQEFTLPDGRRINLESELSPEALKGLKTRVVEIAKYIKTSVVEDGNGLAAAYNLFGDMGNDPDFQDTFFTALGNAGINAARRAKPPVPFSADNPQQAKDHFTYEVAQNNSEATFNAGLYDFKDGATKEDKLRGMLGIATALAGNPQDAGDKAASFVTTYNAAKNFEMGKHAELKQQVFDFYEENYASLTQLIEHYRSSDIQMYEQADIIETYLKGVISTVVDRNHDNLVGRLGEEIEEDGELKLNFLFNGVFNDLAKQMVMGEEEVYTLLGSFGNASAYSDVSVAIFPQIMDEFYKFKLGTFPEGKRQRAQSLEFVGVNFNALFGSRDYSLSQATIANNILRISVDSLVEARDDILIEDSFVERLIDSGVPKSSINALRAEDIDDERLLDTLLDAKVNVANKRVNLFKFDEYRIINGEPNLVPRVYNPNSNTWTPLLKKDGKAFSISQSHLLSTLRGLSPLDLYGSDILQSLSGPALGVGEVMLRGGIPAISGGSDVGGAIRELVFD